jgi:DNA-binding Xre family transcriptional regulator
MSRENITFFCFFISFYCRNIINTLYIKEEHIMGMAEKIRILLVKRGNISEAELARRLGMSTTNLYNRLKRDNFTDRDLQKIAEVLDCTFKAGFVLNDTGEEI